MRLTGVLLSALLAATTSVFAAQAAPMTQVQREQALDVLARRLDHYVLQEHKPALKTKLRAERARYLAIEDPHKFAQALTADMLAVTKDKHLQVWVDAGAPATPGVVSGPPPGPAEMEAARGHGIAAVRRLPGNVGYLRLNSFSGSPDSAEAIDDALGLLKHTDALLIDLRRNGGGGEPALKRLASHFFAKPVELETIAWRECPPPPKEQPDACPTQLPRRVERRWSDAIAAPAYAGGKPVFVLVGRDTFSAAEAFAYLLQQEGRATVVGAVTGGGANPSAMMDMGPGFSIVMPIGVATHPRTGTNWEGVGVKPDVPVGADRALAEGYRRSLAALPPGGDADLNRERKSALADVDGTLGREMAL